MSMRNCVAIDLGASSGRVMLGGFDAHSGQLELREISRTKNRLFTVDDQQCWDIDALEAFIVSALNGLDAEDIMADSIGIDSWGVDFVLLDKQGCRIGLPVSYHDDRTQGIQQHAIKELGRENIYSRTGIQFLPFNTLYQLRALAASQPGWLQHVHRALLVPDYFHYRLTGQFNWEYTNATTTQLLNIKTGQWDRDLLQWAGVDANWFGKTSQPGTQVGCWRSPSGKNVPVVAVATHDTASAVLAAPLTGPDSAWLSSGTWSLMGFESVEPYNDDKALAANITNEGGAEGRFRVLKNIMGLWLLQRICSELLINDFHPLVQAAKDQPACLALINPNDQRFINPVSMVCEIQNACVEQGMAQPSTPAALARCIFDSLALFYRQVLYELEQICGAPFRRLHIVGGGCQNALLNQLCADACGIPVVAGPVEASTLGNIGYQLIARGDLRDVTHLREIIKQNFPLKTYIPQVSDMYRRNWSRFESLTNTAKELCI